VSHFKDSALGCNAVSWAPFNSVGSQSPSGPIRRVVTASCDKTVKIWSLAEGETEWAKQELSSAPAHSDWVRDVAWAPSTGLPVNLIASCSEDKHVYIWSQTAEDSAWKRELLHTFDAPVWRVSWSVTGSTRSGCAYRSLAVSPAAVAATDLCLCCCLLQSNFVCGRGGRHPQR
jgi:protein transport protein SEC13